MFFQLCFSYCNAALSIAIHISSTKWYMASDRNVLIKWEGHCIVSRTVGVRERLCVSVARIWSRTSTYLPLCIQHSWEKAKWKSQIVKDTFNVLSFQQINRCFWLDSPCSGSRLPTTGRDLSCSSTRSSPWRTCGWSLIITQNTFSKKQWDIKTAGANTWYVWNQVSAWQTIQWMRDPQPIERAESFPPFQCDYKVIISSHSSSWYFATNLVHLQHYDVYEFISTIDL